ncbi:MAG: BamA/TamA family outer membrane protein [Bacteroidales bacterium]
MPDEKYLLHSYEIETDEGEFDQKELNNYIKQKPNQRIFFWRFYLSLYNLSSSKKDNGINNWLKEIGEPPVVYDPDMTEKSSEQLRLYMRNKGYYHAGVSDSTLYRRKRARVLYKVQPGDPYRIRDITYFFQDGALSDLVMADTGSNRFRRGELFDVDALQDERLRIEELLRNKGYYKFTRDFVYFEVDSALRSNQVDVTLGIRNFPRQDSTGRIRHGKHPVYNLRNVYLETVDNRAILTSSDVDLSAKDTLVYDGVLLIFREKPTIRPAVVTQKNYILPGGGYQIRDVQRTYRNLSSLSAFSGVDIRFSEVGGPDNLLDCNVQIAPAVRQSYTVKLEGTNSGGNMGAAGNFNYQHRNLFGGSEQFDLTFLGAIESQQKTNFDSLQGSGLNFMQEFGVEARLRIPKFLLPFKTDQFIRQFNPQTNIRLSYNYQNRPMYIRTLANASFGYEWKGNENLIHRVWPIEASLILTPYQRIDFANWLQGKYLYYSYLPHVILDSRYSVLFSNQKLLKNQNFQDIRFNVETAGNLLYAGYRLRAPEAAEDPYQLLGVDFAQYIKADIDLRTYYFLYEDISLVMRGFAGVGFAYGNSNAMPFERQYFSGGANSIRAWRVKNLGPGSYEDTEETTYPNQTGDVKLEANMEYRFKLIWKLEAALFVDVGNIWSLSTVDDRPGAGFEFDRFYKELAVGTGFGTRFVFNFLILRLDLGIPSAIPIPWKDPTGCRATRGAWRGSHLQHCHRLSLLIPLRF